MADEDFTPRGGVDMGLTWIKSNWTILAMLGAGAVYMIQTDSDTKHSFANIDKAIVQITTAAEKRAGVADDFYEAQRALNLPIRVQNLETQVRDMLLLIQRGQDRQESVAQAVNDKLQGISVQLNVVASKVDDLRDDVPRKTNLIYTPRP